MSNVIDIRRSAPATQERPLLQLLPPVPPSTRPLPRHLSPRRAPLRLRVHRLGSRLPHLKFRMRRLGRRVERLVYGPVADRAFLLLALAVLGATIGALVLLEARYPSEYLGTAR